MPHSTKPSQTEIFTHLVETVHRLRAPGGCPWDRAQTHQSLRQYLVEEAYEVLDVLDEIDSSESLKKEKIKSSFREELGDLLMQVLLHSEMADEVGAFDIYDVAKTLDEKLVRRHPHVFGSEEAKNADHALKNWEKEKAKEKKAAAPGSSVLDGLPRNLPALQKAARMIEKVSKVGFQWKDMHGPLDKVEEEFLEFKEEVLEIEKIPKNAGEEIPAKVKQRVESELGDLFLTLCNVAFQLKISPEDALRGTIAKFEKRFRHVERRIHGKGKALENSNLEEMDQYWDEAKKLEGIEIWGLTGGIASGKSKVAQLFAEFGIPVVDADKISRTLVETAGPARDEVQERFGTTDRGKLREIIFNDPVAKLDLEKILHPKIQEASLREAEKWIGKSPVMIYEAALLVETGRYKELDGLIVVESPKSLRMKRLCDRDGISTELAEQIMNSQVPDSSRREHADLVIENTGSVEELRSQVQKWVFQKNWQLYKN